MCWETSKTRPTDTQYFLALFTTLNKEVHSKFCRNLLITTKKNPSNCTILGFCLINWKKHYLFSPFSFVTVLKLQMMPDTQIALKSGIGGFAFTLTDKLDCASLVEICFLRWCFCCSKLAASVYVSASLDVWWKEFSLMQRKHTHIQFLLCASKTAQWTLY